LITWGADDLRRSTPGVIAILLQLLNNRGPAGAQERTRTFTACTAGT
jgi:hypothetical protein